MSYDNMKKTIIDFIDKLQLFHKQNLIEQKK
jgi:hypothetical protein